MKLWGIEDSGPLVRIDHHNLPDLDELMLDVLMHPDMRDQLEDDWSWVTEGEDVPTRFAGAYKPEAMVGWYRTNPCTCGEEHSFDMGSVDSDDDGLPVGKAARGAFMAVHFG
ncbi:hypothetical protein J2X55_002267 [Microbacterium sp. 1154]|uniref:hypothetical protein n=1 Tax=Microbacterium sp. 1154 TaxID=2817733 RepID=UPI00285D0097|nr:hypothetical protein [Microbacterium sp. 1154]MDR6691355.1 hypothetical protein [Microbacterium sp. 1154]